jgi:hypothetical protein
MCGLLKGLTTGLDTTTKAVLDSLGAAADVVADPG